ncbi:hypothetical protein As57867_003315, partial [Aphanomyces stellatus]
SPTNWYACGGKDDVSDLVAPTNDTKAVPSFNSGIQDCLSDTTRMFAKTNVQTLELTCHDATKCNVSPDFAYFLRNTTDWGDRMTLTCMWEYNAKAGTSRSFCLIPMLEQTLAATFKPKTALVNDPDRCGFYFISYAAVARYSSQFGQFFVDNYDIEWSPSSYVANQAQFSQFNYTLLKQSTLRQNKDDFVGPHPYASVVQSFNH